MLQGVRIGSRIFIGFALLIALLLALAVTNRYSGQQVQQASAALQHSNQAAMNGEQIKVMALQLRRAEKDMMLNLDNPAKTRDYYQKWQQQAVKLQQLLAQALQAEDTEDRPAIDAIREQVGKYQAGFNSVAHAATEGQYPSISEMNTAMEPFKPAIHSLEDLTDRYLASLQQQQQQHDRQIGAAIAQLNQTALIVTVLAVVAGIAVALMIAASIRKPLLLLEASVQQSVAANDLTRQIAYRGKDEVGAAIGAINRFFAAMRELLGSFKQGGERINQAAGALRNVADEQNRAIGYQAEATASTAASIEELTVSITHVSDAASDIEQDSRQAQRLATEGRSLAEQTAREINRIADAIRQSSDVIASLERRSTDIGGIVVVIKDIADQTNLLALNAAIEAARAGEQGRGFAVVADEVRQLAEKTTHATNQISGMIQAVQKDTSTAVTTMSDASRTVDEGVELTRRVAESLGDIHHRASQSVDKISGIASAISEQGAASTQIAQNIEKIAQMSEQNSAATAQLADLAHTLNQLSDTLAASVRQYQT